MPMHFCQETAYPGAFLCRTPASEECATHRDTRTNALPASRVVLVAGGACGVGRSISRALLRQGFRVIIAHSGCPHQGESFQRATNIPVMTWDMMCPHACQHHIRSLEEQYGALHALVHHVETLGQHSILSVHPEIWRHTLEAHLHTLFHMVRACVPLMQQQQWGRIIAMSSIYGHVGQYGMAALSAAHGGIEGFMRTLAQEMAPYGITANSVALGHVRPDDDCAWEEGLLPHEMEHMARCVPLCRFGAPQEIGSLVAFLMSQHSGFMTGHTLHLNGGQHMA